MSESPQTLNPFRSSILADPWQQTVVDVPQIHGQIFSDCLHALDTVQRERQTTSVLIHGAAGAGKTHLLSRLRRSLHVAGSPDRPVGEREAIFSWVRLNSSPGMLWRHVRRKLVEDLLRPDVGNSALMRVLVCSLFNAWPSAGNIDKWWEFATSESPDELDSIVDQIADSASLPSDLTVVLRHLVRGRYKSESRAWLRGDSLPESTLAQLGLPGEPAEAEPEQTSRELVLALCRLIAPTAAIVVGFDQVEALQIHPEDLSGLHTFGQLVSVLHDETQNLLIISCVQSAFAASLKDRAIGADYDRMRDFGLWQLSPLNWDEVVQLINARLRAVPEVAESRAEQTDPLWPLMESDVRTCLSDGKSTTPRVLLAHCGRLFEAWQRGVQSPEVQGSVPDSNPPSLETLLHEAWSAQLSRSLAENQPVQSESILTDALPRLLQLVQAEGQAEGQILRDPLLLDVDLVWQTELQTLGLSCCLHENMNSLAARLKRLHQQCEHKRLTKLVILRDERIEISKGAKKVREWLEAFDKRVVQILELSAEQFAALDALRMLDGDARSGDLAPHGQTIAPEILDAWLRTQLPPILHDLSQELLAPTANLSAAEPPLVETIHHD